MKFAGIGICNIFCSCDLNFDPTTLIYERDPYSLDTECANMNSIRQGFRKLSSDRQTDKTEIIYHATSQVVNKFLVTALGKCTARHYRQTIRRSI